MHSSLTLQKPQTSPFKMALWVLRAAPAVLLAVAASAQQVPGCGALQNAFGPFDYRPDTYVYESTYKSHKALVNIVEQAHYTIETEMLTSRKSGLVVSPGADLSYTLRAFPNHHKALMTLIALSEKEKVDKPRDSIYTVDCWFRRAVAWKQDDNVVKMIYSTYLAKTNRRSEAEAQLEAAARQAGDNVFTHHNLGLVYFDMKMYDKALFHAHKTYGLGMTVPTLKEQLKSVDKWVELPDAAVAAPRPAVDKTELGATPPQSQ
jgi:tetratricopeptide (TPR) repeat protein